MRDVARPPISRKLAGPPGLIQTLFFEIWSTLDSAYVSFEFLFLAVQGMPKWKTVVNFSVPVPRAASAQITALSSLATAILALRLSSFTTLAFLGQVGQ